LSKKFAERARNAECLGIDTAGKAAKVKPEPNSQRAEQFAAQIANTD
jgi:hypothetical protein